MPRLHSVTRRAARRARSRSEPRARRAGAGDPGARPGTRPTRGKNPFGRGRRRAEIHLAAGSAGGDRCRSRRGARRGFVRARRGDVASRIQRDRPDTVGIRPPLSRGRVPEAPDPGRPPRRIRRKCVGCSRSRRTAVRPARPHDRSRCVPLPGTYRASRGRSRAASRSRLLCQRTAVGFGLAKRVARASISRAEVSTVRHPACRAPK